MSPERIKEILSASRPDGQDDADPQVAEALKLAQADPALRQWLEKERETDRMLSACLSAVKSPEGLKEKILADARVLRLPVSFWRRPVLWAAAAVLAAGLIAFFQWNPSFGPAESLAFDRYERETRGWASGLWFLPHQSAELIDLRKWLAAARSPSDFVLPAKFEDLAPLGCRLFKVQGNKVSLICFKLQDGKTEAHLFVIDRAAIQNAPPETGPVYARRDGWTTASWSDPRQVYVLASQAGPETLEKFF